MIVHIETQKVADEWGTTKVLVLLEDDEEMPGRGELADVIRKAARNLPGSSIWLPYIVLRRGGKAEDHREPK